MTCAPEAWKNNINKVVTKEKKLQIYACMNGGMPSLIGKGEREETSYS